MEAKRVSIGRVGSVGWQRAVQQSMKCEVEKQRKCAKNRSPALLEPSPTDPFLHKTNCPVCSVPHALTNIWRTAVSTEVRPITSVSLQYDSLQYVRTKLHWGLQKTNKQIKCPEK